MVVKLKQHPSVRAASSSLGGKQLQCGDASCQGGIGSCMVISGSPAAHRAAGRWLKRRPHVSVLELQQRRRAPSAVRCWNAPNV